MLNETILYAPGFNDAVMLRTMALHGVNTIGMRVADGTELAQLALMRTGCPVTETLLEPQEVTLILAELMRSESYFHAVSFADAEALSAALRTARMLLPEHEQENMVSRLRKGVFPEKNAAVLRIYSSFLAVCRERRVIDGIMLMRLAIADAKPLACNILVPETVHLTPLENALLSALCGDRVRKISLAALFGKQDKPLICGEITACCGASNEVRHIFAEIARNKYSFDSCTVAVSDPAQYAPLFREIAAEYQIPVMLRCGTPLRETAPAKLYMQILLWEQGHFGVDALRALFDCDAFRYDELVGLLPENSEHIHSEINALAVICGQLRLCMDADINRTRLAAYRAALPEDAPEQALLPCAEALFHIFERGYAAILRTFSRCQSAADQTVLSILCGGFARCAQYPAVDEMDFIASLLEKTVNAQLPEAGAVYITTPDNAPEALRQHMFIAGLSADLFPAGSAENYLLLDADLSLLDKDAAPTTDRIIMQKKQQLRALLGLLSAMDIPAALSYSDFQAADLKDANASSVLFELWSEANHNDDILAFTGAVRHMGYFDAALSDTDDLGSAYRTGTIFAGTAKSLSLSGAFKGERKFSPTAIEAFQACPKQFLLGSLLHVAPPEPDDVFTIIAPNILGSLLHDCFRQLHEQKLSEAAFLQTAETAFRRHLAARPPIHAEAGNRAFSEFMEMAKHGYDMICPDAGFAAEMELTVKHPSGIILHGFTDRIETGADGSLIIIDFKTGSRIRHIANDPVTCIQTLLYAYMLEQETGKTVSECRYYYLRDGAEICCAWDETARMYVDSLLGSLADALDTGEYPCTDLSEKKEPCRYCPYLAYCGKMNGKEEQDDDDES